MRNRLRGRLPAVLAGAALCLIAGGTYVGLSRAPHTRALRTEAAMDRVRLLRSEGRTSEALESALDLSRELEGDKHAPAWQRSDAARVVATLKTIANLPDSTRRAMAEADRADGTLRDLINQGQYRAAARQAKDQLALRRCILGDAAPEVAASLSTLAEIDMLQGDKPGARDLYNQALSMRRKLLGEMHPDVAQTLEALGLAEKNLSNLAEAGSCYQRSLEIRRELFGELHLSIVASLNRQAELLRRESRPDEALALFHRALQILQKTSQAESPTAVDVLCNLGLAEYYRAEYASGERYLRRAVEISRRNRNVSLETLVFGLSVYGGTLWKERMYAMAEPVQEECARIYEFLRGQGKPEAQSYHELGIYASIALTQLAEGDSTAAWRSLERSLGRTLLDALVPPLDPPAPGRDPGLSEDARFCSLEEVQSHLTDSTALVGWVTAFTKKVGIWDYPSWAYVIRRGGPVHWVRIGSARGGWEGPGVGALSDLILMLNEAADWPIRVAPDADLIEKARGVYREVVRPLEPSLSGVTRLVVIPAFLGTGVLESMVDENGLFLGQKFEISYTPSATLFVWMLDHARPRGNPRNWRVLTVGDPGSSSAAVGGEPLSSIPGSRLEADRISAIFPASKVLLGTEASRQGLVALVRSRELAKYDLIHFALHTSRPNETAPVSMFLLGAPGGAIGPRGGVSLEDERISDLEIRGVWKLDADLVTLSACTTRVANVETEERAGLSEAFLRDGAHSVLASVRAVDDEAASLLMRRFYEDLAGAYRDQRHGHVGQPLSKVEALYEASNWLRQYRDPQGRQPFAHPAYWSTFTLTGDPGE